MGRVMAKGRSGYRGGGERGCKSEDGVSGSKAEGTRGYEKEKEAVGLLEEREAAGLLGGKEGCNGEEEVIEIVGKKRRKNG
ncbi:hypothetical protein ACH5RR_007604 [Cinchona calisaya]|uniref:Uncharacterized protein n=1 Tax=Cinchona calisaya TaxID=153742 RepID=A0ABD3A993_9GENT